MHNTQSVGYVQYHTESGILGASVCKAAYTLRNRTSPALHTGLRLVLILLLAHANFDSLTAQDQVLHIPQLWKGRLSATATPNIWHNNCLVAEQSIVKFRLTISCLLANTRTALCLIKGSSTMACITAHAQLGSTSWLNRKHHCVITLNSDAAFETRSLS